LRLPFLSAFVAGIASRFAQEKERITGHSENKKKEEVGIRVLVPLAGFWFFFRIFADSFSLRTFFSW